MGDKVRKRGEKVYLLAAICSDEYRAGRRKMRKSLFFSQII